jgi:xanthine dehydrogenase accessory factor
MVFTAPPFSPGQDPVRALAGTAGETVLAVITGVEGPSYRPLGAVMAFLPGGGRAGTLSSGCVEADLALHADRALAGRAPVALRYGRGSPFADIQLPCGGGLDILLVPRPDPAVMAALMDRRAARLPVTLAVGRETGALALSESGATGWKEDSFLIRFEPALRFVVFGKGPEAATFAALVQSAGYPNLLLSPDGETLQAGRAAGCDTRHLTGASWPADLAADRWTAVTLFFHDHDWEPPILAAALGTPAFYIGAQGSRRARDLRLIEMQALGAAPADLARLRGPVGLIPSARDAGTLAVSVLAEVLAEAMQQRR